MNKSKLLNLHRDTKRAIFFSLDMFAVLLGLYLAHALRYGSLKPEISLINAWPLFPIVALMGAGLIIVFRLPQIKLTALENQAILRVAMVSICLIFSSVVVSYMLQIPGPRSASLIFGALFFFLATGLRILLLNVLMAQEIRAGLSHPVAIYGAGAAGIQLASALRQTHEMRPVFFVDDNPNLHGLVIAGLMVYPPDLLSEKIEKHEIEKVLLAMPSVPHVQQDSIISQMEALGVEVQVLPSFVHLISGKGFKAKFSPVSPDRLLGRNKVSLDIPEITQAYTGNVVMVTGAGGSIGAELCRQLVDCQPARIVLFEQSEFALYSIDHELQQIANEKGISIVPKLGSVTDYARLSDVVRSETVDTILHAAAYKHVPLVEENELEGARNNVIGTQVVADVASEAGIERLILVSTDKAVRPTNIMGATKRMAELVLQDRQTRTKNTKYAMVRFGNVLGSSGSMMPLFQKQIDQGGPVTVTHPDVTRFFMTIPEAARLVLLAGAYAEGGDVFVLDMGEPQKIIDIARKLIELSGRTVKDPVTGEGDIEIQITGLRPGEKLFEELLLDNDSLIKTPHPKILRAEEAMLSAVEVAKMLDELEGAILEVSPSALRSLVERCVDGYHRYDQKI